MCNSLDPSESEIYYSYAGYDSEIYESEPYESDYSGTQNFTENDKPISIDPYDNPDPHTKQTYTVHFFSHDVQTTVTSTPAVLRDWLYKVLNFHRTRRHKLVVGLGVQWNPSSTITPPPPATLQLCIGSQCLIFQLLYTNSVPLALRRFLNDPCNTFVGVWNYNDAPMLRRSYHGLDVSRIVDVRDVAAEWGGLSRQISMERLAECVLGYAVDNGVMKPEWIGRSDWDATWLSEDQVQYACVDAFVSFLLGKELRVWDWNN